MPAIPTFRCPVCRATQEPQAVCRRCSADLALYLKTINSIAIAESECQASNPHTAHRARSYLRWLLAPK